ncbi:hypothetical protein LTS10_009335 [Elasticomyces elasticus]|nr:hypothetical protein LTS10_009335 [Elasticomyces elasticus]
MWLRQPLLCLCIGGIAGQANNVPNHPSQMKGKSGFQKIITKTVTALSSGANNASIPYSTPGTMADMASQFSASDLLPYDDDASSSSISLGVRGVLSGISSSTSASLYGSTMASSIPVMSGAGLESVSSSSLAGASTYTPTILCTTGTLNALSVLESAQSSYLGIAPTAGGSPLPACPVDPGLPGTPLSPETSSSTPSSSSSSPEGSNWSTTINYGLTTITIHQDTTSSSTPPDSAWSTTTVILDSSTATFVSPFGSSSWYSPVSFSSPTQTGVSLSPLDTSTAQWLSTSSALPPVTGIPPSDVLPSGTPSSSTSITSTYFSYDPLLTISPAVGSTLSTSVTYSGLTGVTSSVSNGPGSSTFTGTIASSSTDNSQSSVVSNSASGSTSVSTIAFSSGTPGGLSSSTTNNLGSSSQSVSGTISIVSIRPGSSSTISVSVESSVAPSDGTVSNSVSSLQSSFTSETLTDSAQTSTVSLSASLQASSTTDSQGFVVPVVPFSSGEPGTASSMSSFQTLSTDSQGSAVPESFTDGSEPTTRSSMASLATFSATSSEDGVVPNFSAGSAQPGSLSFETLSSTDAQGSLVDVTITHTVLTTDSNGNTVPMPLASSNGGGQFTGPGSPTTSLGAGVSGASTMPPNPGSQPTTGASQTMPRPLSTTDSNGVVIPLPSSSGSVSQTITSITTYTGYPLSLSTESTSAAINTHDPQGHPIFAGGQDCWFCPSGIQGFILFGLPPGVYPCSDHPPHFPGSDKWPDVPWPPVTILPDGTPKWGAKGECSTTSLKTYTDWPPIVSWDIIKKATDNDHDSEGHPIFGLGGCWFCPPDIGGFIIGGLFGRLGGIFGIFKGIRPPKFPKIPGLDLEWPDVPWPDITIEPDGTPHWDTRKPDDDPPKSSDPKSSKPKSTSASTTDSTTSTTSSTTSSESSSCEIETVTHYTEYCPASTSGGSSGTCTMTSSTVVASCSATAATTTVTAAPACTKGLDYNEPQGDNGDPDVAACDATIDDNADQGSNGTPPDETASTSSASSASSTTMDAAASSSAWASVNSAASAQSAQQASANSVASSNALAGISSEMASVSLSQAQVLSWLTQPFTTTQWTTSCGSGSADCQSTYTIITLGPTSSYWVPNLSDLSTASAGLITTAPPPPPSTTRSCSTICASEYIGPSGGECSTQCGVDISVALDPPTTTEPPAGTTCRETCVMGNMGVYAGCHTFCSAVPTDPPNFIARPWGTGNGTYGGWLNGTAFAPSGRMTHS